MIKFKEIVEQAESLKTTAEVEALIEGGIGYNFPEFVSIKKRVKLSSKQGAVLDKRLTLRLLDDFKKNHLVISISRLFANRMFRCGKKRKAENMVGKAIRIIQAKKINSDRPLVIFNKAVDAVKTPVSVRVRKKGRKTLYLPYLMTPQAAYNKAARTILAVSRYRKPEVGMSASLAIEIQDIIKSTGAALERKVLLEQLVSENRDTYRRLRPFRRKRGQFRK